MNNCLVVPSAPEDTEKRSSAQTRFQNAIGRENSRSGKRIVYMSFIGSFYST